METQTRRIIAKLVREGWVNVGGGRHTNSSIRMTWLDIVVPRHREVSVGVARDIATSAGWLNQETIVSDYVGIIDQSGETWGVRIPDLPGCYGAGESADAAIRDAASAAREWIAYQEGLGNERPKARGMSEILASREVDVGAGEAAVLIGVLIDEGRTMRANLTFDAGLLGAIDAAAKERGLTRSAFLASAAREKIAARR